VNKLVLVDIDGTVAHRTNREPFEYDKVLEDRPDHQTIETINALWRAGYKIIFISARDDSCFDDSYEWLRLNCPPFIKLYMRKTGDFRKDAVVKEEIYRKHIEPFYDVFCVFDDRNQVVDMWRSLGLKCFQPEAGDF
jgi:hydroxymethylpyrimidine pyrophosphatase-like HAD family hydrolase